MIVKRRGGGGGGGGAVGGIAAFHVANFSLTLFCFLLNKLRKIGTANSLKFILSAKFSILGLTYNIIHFIYHYLHVLNFKIQNYTWQDFVNIPLP